MIRTDDGTAAVRIARQIITSETTGVDTDISYPRSFRDNAGVFVTIKTYPSGDLRGCIGYPEPVFPLMEALELASRGACHDPRFPDLRKNELDKVTVEVTILSVPERLNVNKNDLLETIKIGRDGLMIEFRGRRGLLLPQVPEEWGWTVHQYLENLSMKAGLPSNAWESPDSVIYSFMGEIFSEDIPNGNAVRRQ